MNFKRWLRHSNALKQCFVMLVLGLALGLFALNDLLKVLGVFVIASSLLLIVMSAADSDQLFWKSQLEWWDEDDARFDDWQQGI